ncbi:MAG: deoxynucleoside kinase [Phycisphaerae bacterium]|nr:deoxynucleoside kinase [Phycisphaerae bacterium]
MKEHQTDAATLICVAGAVGAGKTTLARKLGEALGAKVLEEEVSGNELLEAFYRDPVQYALPVQGKFLLSRFCQLRADCWPKEGTVVTDYIFDKDHLFAELNLQGKELEIYRGLWEAVKNRVREPRVVIYLRAEPGLLLERIRQRDRSFERGMELEYLQRLAKAYEKMFSHYDLCPVIRIGSATEPACNEQSWRQLIEELISVVPELAERLK